MGTGAISILFHAWPYGNGGSALNFFTLIFFGLNIVLFLTFCAISIIRYFYYPALWKIMVYHPVQSLFLGTFPMGAATILNIAVLTVNEYYGVGGKGLLYFLWACWWADVFTSIACCFLMIHVMTIQHSHSLDKMTAVWLLPVVTVIVASASGGVIAPSLYKYSASHALVTITLSAVLVTIGITLALMMLTIYLLRLIVHGLPPTATIISVFLPLGPTGQAGFSILLIGQCFRQFLPVYDGESDLLRVMPTGESIEVMCTSICFVLWSMCTMWVIFAFLSIQNVIRKTPIPFKVPFWGLIFPNGVYANTTISLGVALDSGFFKVWGCTYAALTLCMWLYVAWRSIGLVHTREIFEAPCLEAIDVEKLRRRGVRIPYGRRMDEQGLPASLGEAAAYPDEKVPESYRSPYGSGCSQGSLPHHSEIRLPPIDLPFPGAAAGDEKKSGSRDARIEETPASRRSSRVADIVSVRRTDLAHESAVWGGDAMHSPKSAAPQPLPMSPRMRDDRAQVSSEGTRVPSSAHEAHPAPALHYGSPRVPPSPHSPTHSRTRSLHAHPTSPYEPQMPQPYELQMPLQPSPPHSTPRSPGRTEVRQNWRDRYRDNNPYN